MMEFREGVRPTPPQPTHEGGKQIRTVWDHRAGREWRVWASDCRDVPGARGDECLIFDCGTTVRRVWSPPHHWHALGDDELLALVDAGLDR